MSHLCSIEYQSLTLSSHPKHFNTLTLRVHSSQKKNPANMNDTHILCQNAELYFRQTIWTLHTKHLFHAPSQTHWKYILCQLFLSLKSFLKFVLIFFTAGSSDATPTDELHRSMQIQFIYLKTKRSRILHHKSIKEFIRMLYVFDVFVKLIYGRHTFKLYKQTKQRLRYESIYINFRYLEKTTDKFTSSVFWLEDVKCFYF